MQIATATLKLHPMHTVDLKGVTPGEARILAVMHQPNAGEFPISNVVLTGEATDTVEDDETGESRTVPRSNESELERLRHKFRGKMIKKGKEQVDLVSSLYPGDAPTLPETFAQVRIEAKEAKAPKAKAKGTGDRNQGTGDRKAEKAEKAEQPKN